MQRLQTISAAAGASPLAPEQQSLQSAAAGARNGASSTTRKEQDHSSKPVADSLLPGQKHFDPELFKSQDDQDWDGGTEGLISTEVLAGDPQLSTIIFNEAVLYCRLGRFRSSLLRLDLLLQNLLILDTALAIRACYLCLDIYFLVYRGLEADSPHARNLEVCVGEVLTMLETCESRAFHDDDEGSAEMESDPDSTSNEGSEATSLSSSKASSEIAQAQLKFNIRLYRAKLQLIISNSKGAKKEIKSALEVYEKEVKPGLTLEDEAGQHQHSS